MPSTGTASPHKFFAFQPFNESSTWRADIVRVTWDGDRIPIDGGWAGYQWDDLVHMSALQGPSRLRHAYMGVGATVDFLDDALDWVATNTPADLDTRYFEATVTYFQNTRGPTVTCCAASSGPSREHCGDPRRGPRGRAWWDDVLDWTGNVRADRRAAHRARPHHADPPAPLPA